MTTLIGPRGGGPVAPCSTAIAAAVAIPSDGGARLCAISRASKTSTSPAPTSICFLGDKPRAETRVVAAMSGGVDSSVVAALLKYAGYDVVGVTLQLYDHGAALKKPGACCAGQDIHDARRVAEALGIPHYVLDYESRFRAQVMEDFADTYLKGSTPIPCVRCNQTVKFSDLLRDRARSRRRLPWPPATTSAAPSMRTATPQLARAADPDRDQSYFLFATTRDQLDFLRFPLGGMRKADVRRAASALGLQVAAKPDSQDICFVPAGKYSDIVEKLRPGAAEPGDIVHLDGRIMGRHEGVIRYTIGQRRGLGVATGEPLVRRQARCAQQTRHRRPARSAAHPRPRHRRKSTGSAKAHSRTPAQRERLRSPASAPPARPSPAAWRWLTANPASPSTRPKKASPPARPACSTRRRTDALSSAAGSSTSTVGSTESAPDVVSPRSNAAVNAPSSTSRMSKRRSPGSGSSAGASVSSGATIPGPVTFGSVCSDKAEIFLCLDAQGSRGTIMPASSGR